MGYSNAASEECYQAGGLGRIQRGTNRGCEADSRNLIFRHGFSMPTMLL